MDIIIEIIYNLPTKKRQDKKIFSIISDHFQARASLF